MDTERRQNIAAAMDKRAPLNIVASLFDALLNFGAMEALLLSFRALLDERDNCQPPCLDEIRRASPSRRVV
jgi:hypothetical protein